jgi:hypothetical protein
MDSVQVDRHVKEETRRFGSRFWESMERLQTQRMTFRAKYLLGKWFARANEKWD